MCVTIHHRETVSDQSWSAITRFAERIQGLTDHQDLVECDDDVVRFGDAQLPRSGDVTELSVGDDMCFYETMAFLYGAGILSQGAVDVEFTDEVNLNFVRAILSESMTRH